MESNQSNAKPSKAGKATSTPVTSTAAAPAQQSASKPVTKVGAKRAARPAVRAAKMPVAKKSVAVNASPSTARSTIKPAVKPTVKAPAKPQKAKKAKMVRDSISVPKDEYQTLGELKILAGKLGVEVKKTELIRAGIKALSSMSSQALLTALNTLPSLKANRLAKSS